MSNSNLVGAFSPYTSEINAEAQTAFNEGTKDLLGVKYSAVAVSQQVVAGMNFHFFCNAKSATQYPVNNAAIVSIYKPLTGEAHITNIKVID